MKKLLIALLVLCSCQQKITKMQIVAGKDTLFLSNSNFDMYVKASGTGHNDFKTGTETFTFNLEKDTIKIHDTVKIIPSEKELQETLLMYYKAGWIEAMNSDIDLYNARNFTTNKLYRARDLAWRKMENQVRSGLSPQIGVNYTLVNSPFLNRLMR